MATRRTFLAAGLSVAAASLVAPARRVLAQASSVPPAYILGATAVTEVFGERQRLVAVALEYDQPVASAALDPAQYAVESRTVIRVYANAGAELADEGMDGPFVIVELSSDDEAGLLYVHGAPANFRRPAAVSMTITPTGLGPVMPAADTGAADGPPDFGSQPQSVATTAARNLVVDDFKQAEFRDPETGDALAYHLFVTKDRDPSLPLPLVLFMHDAGVSSPVVDSTLVQGLGAVAWASPEDQARHPAIVLAPQYASVVVNDQSEATTLLETTLHLLDRIAAEHNADRNRLYTTGQSMGGMMSIAMMVREPELFAAGFLVACQWELPVVRPLAKQKLWVMVSEGDEKAFPGQNAIMEVIEGEGTTVSRATWDGTSTPAEFAALVAEQRALGAPVNYTALQRGTVVPAGQQDNGGSNHQNTWRIAYTIPGIRDWIMSQSRQV